MPDEISTIPETVSDPPASNGGLGIAPETVAVCSGTAAPARQRRRLQAVRVRRAWKVLRTALALSVILTAGFLIYSWIGTAAAIRVVEQQAEAIRDGRIDEAYQLFSADYRADNSLPMFQAWVGRHEEFSRAQNMHIWSRILRSQSAVLWGLVEDYRGQRYPVRYQLIREEGHWRIHELQMRRSWAEESIDDLPRTSFI